MALNFKLRKNRGGYPQKEQVSYWTLHVTILRARIKTSSDLLSKPDCFVELVLPTATARTIRTKTIPNNNKPEWNETFTFRVPIQLKNVLEIHLFDEDVITQDDFLSTVLLDISSLKMGVSESRVFTINSKKNNKDELDVAFQLLPRKETTHDYLSNGILVAPPFSKLEVRVEKLTEMADKKDKVLKLNGAFMETLSLGSEEKLSFFTNRDREMELSLTGPGSWGEKLMSSSAPMLNSVTLKPLGSKQTETVSLKTKQDTVDIALESIETEADHLDVRLGFDLPPQEKEFLTKRKVIVAQALEKILGYKISPEKVPVIAVVCSGNGAMARTGLLGSLKGLKETGVLDAATYITGVSGSTWTMSAVYQDPLWSQTGLDPFISEGRDPLTNPKVGKFSLEKMQYYHSEMKQKEQLGHHTSFVDLMALIFEHITFGRKVSSTLSEQQKTVEHGQNPLPIYTAVNIRDKSLKGFESDAEWCEFTPFEVGIHKYGAFIPSELFGSHFYLGRLVKKLPELRVPFLIGIWSSAVSANLSQVWKKTFGSIPLWSKYLGPDIKQKEKVAKEDPQHPPLDTMVVNEVSTTSKIMTDFLKTRPFTVDTNNFMRGLFLHRNYSHSSNFTAWKESHPDAFPNQLTPSDLTLRLVDSAHSINIACAPVLRPERRADLMIILAYDSNMKCNAELLEKTAKYCSDHKIPFPKADFGVLEQQPPQEVYLFEDQDQLSAPIVVFLPMVNMSYKEYKAPGQKRETEDELRLGQVDVSSSSSPYSTTKLEYSGPQYDALLDLTCYNLTNNKEQLYSAIQRATQRRSWDQGQLYSTFLRAVHRMSPDHDPNCALQ